VPTPCFTDTCSVALSAAITGELQADVIFDEGGGLSCVDPAGVGITVPAVKVYRETADSHAANDAFELVSWDAEVYDYAPNPMHSTTTNPTRLTAPFDGLYRIDANVRYAAATTTGKRYTALRKNGVDLSPNALYRSDAATLIAGDLSSQPISVIMDLLAGDYIEVLGFQNRTDGPAALAYHVGHPDTARGLWAAMTFVSRL